MNNTLGSIGSRPGLLDFKSQNVLGENIRLNQGGSLRSLPNTDFSVFGLQSLLEDRSKPENINHNPSPLR